MKLGRIGVWLGRIVALAMLLTAPAALAQGMAGGQMDCMRMGGPGMFVGMVFMWLFALAAIGALVALTVFLLRRSQPTKPA